MTDYVVRSEEAVVKAFRLRRQDSELQHAINLALQRVKPADEKAARAAFTRNYLRDGATLDGVACYVAAVFSAPLKRRKLAWWQQLEGDDLHEARKKLDAFKKARARCLLTPEQEAKLLAALKAMRGGEQHVLPVES